MQRNKIVIGTRGSKLALKQSTWVRGKIQEKYPHLKVDLQIIKTRGDVVLEAPLSKIGDKGLFVKELEVALLDKRIDLAVHSMKDLPTSIPLGLVVGAVTRREDIRDALISKHGTGLKALPSGAVVATSSLRRRAQLLAYRPDLKVVDMRGNIDTRLRKLEQQDLDALVVAAVGLKRLGLKHKITEIIPIEILLPAVGQGALGIELRENDGNLCQWVAFLNHHPTEKAVTAERSFLQYLKGGCQIPVGAFAWIEDSTLFLEGMVADLEGKKIIRDKVCGNPEEAEALGIKLGKQLVEQGAKEILEKLCE